jgi:chromosomal replication initiator protein
MTAVPHDSKDRIEAIQNAVAKIFHVPIAELREKDSKRTVAVPRQVAMYLASQMTGASLPEIGQYFGGKHHTTVMHSIAKIDEHRQTDQALDRVVRTVQEKLQG